jgi:hypothetical protein
MSYNTPLFKLNFGEEEIQAVATKMTADTKKYPVYYHSSDTIGEKEAEEFFTENEQVNLNRFTSLGVIENHRPISEEKWMERLQVLENLFAKENLRKEEVLAALQLFIPNFVHQETGKYLDSKM